MYHSSDTINGLLRMLDDPDMETYQCVREGILEIGYSSYPKLQTLLSNTQNVLLKVRCEELLHQVRIDYYVSELRVFFLLGEKNMQDWEFVHLLCEYCNAEYSKVKVKKTIHDFKESFYENYTNENAVKNATNLKQFIFQDQSFTFNYHALSLPSLFVDTMLSSRFASTMMISYLYLQLASVYHWYILPIAIPENIILAYAKNEWPKSQKDILFYINPANGEIFSKKGIELFLEKYNYENKMEYYLPSTNQHIAFLYAKQLSAAYRAIGERTKAMDLERLALISVQ